MTIQPKAMALAAYQPLASESRLFPLCHWQAISKDGKLLGKTPSVKDWSKRDFEFADMVAHMEGGSNVGFKLGNGYAAIDYDPRRNKMGDALDRLCTTFHIDLSNCAVIDTGGGGVHAILKIPPNWRGREQVPGFEGIEFKHSPRRYLVAAGSIHPGDEDEGIPPGRPYVLRPGSPPIDQTLEAPAALLEAFAHLSPPEHERGSGVTGFGNFAGRLKADFLSRIPVERVRSGSDPSFEQVMMSAHWGSGGQDREDFVEWCVSDPLYADHADIIRKRWDSCAPRVNSIKTGLLFKMLEREGVQRHEMPVESASILFDTDDLAGIDDREPASGTEAAEPLPARKIIEANPFIWRDPADIPARDFLYGNTLLRGAVTVTLGHGGGGKTALTIAEDLALVTGCTLLHDQPKHLDGVNVWAINLEDDRDELARRFAAAATSYGVGPTNGESQPDWASRLCVNGSETELCIAKTTRDGTTISVPDVEAVKANIRRHGFDVVTVDPFVSSHRVSENDNGAIDLVVKQWAKIASECCVAVQLVHHSRKTNGSSVTDEDARGAVALKAGARIMRQVNAMTEQQAKDADIEEEDRFDYFSVSQGKRNMSRRDGGLEWYKFVSVCLPNGDEVGVVTPFTFTARKLTSDQLETARRALEDGQARCSHLSPNYVGKVVARALGMDASKVKPLIDRWLRDEALIVVRRPDEHRKPREFVHVGDWSKAVPPEELSAEELQALDELAALRADPKHCGLV